MSIRIMEILVDNYERYRENIFTKLKEEEKKINDPPFFLQLLSLAFERKERARKGRKTKKNPPPGVAPPNVPNTKHKMGA